MNHSAKPCFKRPLNNHNMHTNTLPPSDRDEVAVTKVNNVLRDKLRSLRDTGEWSNSSIAKALGYNIAVVSQYLNDDGNKYQGDVGKLERRVDDFLRNEYRRRASGVTTTASEVAQELQIALEYIRKTSAVGEIFAASGEGKTRAIELYVRDNPTAILFHVRSWSRDLSSVEASLFETVGRAGYDNRTKRAVFLCQKLCGSGRLLIIDDAHKLTKPALQWFFDFHDETNIPIAFVGTYSLEQTLNEDPQRSSRVGISYPIKSRNIRPLVAHLVKELVPESNGELSELIDRCEELAVDHGHFRNVHQQLKLCVEIKEGNPRLSWGKAFEQAAVFRPNRPKLKTS